MPSASVKDQRVAGSELGTAQLEGRRVEALALRGELRITRVQIDRGSELTMATKRELDTTPLAVDRIERAPDHGTPRRVDRPEWFVLMPGQRAMLGVFGEQEVLEHTQFGREPFCEPNPESFEHGAGRSDSVAQVGIEPLLEQAIEARPRFLRRCVGVEDLARRRLASAAEGLEAVAQ